ncbi:MAG: hypothetical protein QHG99_03530 [Methanomicrobiales archaeon]|nr:hypothetical protein [Methanomicrobiales archaeon]
MGIKKPNNERNWSKIFAIVFGIIFAFMFVGTYLLTILGSTIFSPGIKPGDTVTADLTIRDGAGRSILTTDQSEYSRAMSAGYSVFFTPALQIKANGTYNETIIGVDAYFPPQWTKFGILLDEMEMIASGVVGMKEGERKTIDLSTIAILPQSFAAEDFEASGGNFTSAKVGDQMVIGFRPAFSDELVGNDTISYLYRVMEIVGKDDQHVILSHSYATADIKIRQIV